RRRGRRGPRQAALRHVRSGRSRIDPARRPRAAIPESNRGRTNGSHRSQGALLWHRGQRSKPHPRRSPAPRPDTFRGLASPQGLRHIWPFTSARTLIFLLNLASSRALSEASVESPSDVHAGQHREVRLLWLPPATGRHQTSTPAATVHVAAQKLNRARASTYLRAAPARSTPRSWSDDNRIPHLVMSR